MMTRQHYEKFAELIQRATEKVDSPDSFERWVREDFCPFLKADNGRFDAARFLKACGLGGPVNS